MVATLYFGNRCGATRLTEHARAGLLPEGVSLRFTAPKTALLKTIGFMKNWGTEGIYPTVEPMFSVSLEEDVKGVPSLNPISMIENLGGQPYGPGSVGWTRATFSEPYPTIHEDEGLHLRFWVSKWMEKIHPKFLLMGLSVRQFGFGSPDHCLVIPKSQQIDTALGGAMYDRRFHKAWVPINHTVAFTLEFEDGSYYGQPYVDRRDWGLGISETMGNCALAQEFNVPKTINVKRLAVMVRKAGTNPTDKLYASLKDLSTDEYVFHLVILEATELKTHWRWAEAVARATLEKDRNYRLEITSPASKRENGYEVIVMRNYYDSPDIFATAHLNGGRYSYDAGQTWKPWAKGVWDLTYYLVT